MTSSPRGAFPSPFAGDVSHREKQGRGGGRQCGTGDSLSGVAREERLTEVTIRRDLKEVREQSPPGPEAGAGRSRLGQWEECSRPQC